MGGQDVKEGGVYKKSVVFRENDQDTSIRNREEARRTLRKESE